MAIITVTPDPVTFDQDLHFSLENGLLFGSLDAANASLFNYIAVAQDIVIEVSGTGVTYNAAQTEVTGGTINSITIKKLIAGAGAFPVGVYSGFAMSAAAFDAAVRDYRVTGDPAQWHALFGLNDFNVLSSQWNLRFRGFAGDDTVQGGDGDDVFVDQDFGDTDVFNGGNGSDNVFVGGGVSTLNGGAGFDFASFLDLVSPSQVGMTINTVTGAYSSAAIAGASGILLDFEFIFGTRHNDAFVGKALGETFIGEDGDDTMSGFGGIDTLSGGTGADTIYGGDEAGTGDTLQGGTAADRIYGGGGNDTIEGQEDSDTFLSGDAGNDKVYGGDGNDRADGGAGVDLLYGEAGADNLTGGADGDYLYGGDEAVGGDTYLGGGAGIDRIYAGAGNDRVDGGADNDAWLGGEAGADYITGGDGDDRIDGGGEADNIFGNAGRDYVTGGAGNDTITGGDEAGAGDTWLGGDAGIDYIYGGAGNDRIDGGADGDTLRGQDGDDTITGGLGTDYLDGGAGIDYLEGGASNDQMTGGAGADTFDLNPGTGLDSVADFTDNVDTIRIDPGFGFANVAAVLARTIQSGNHARILLNATGTDSVYLLNYLTPGSGHTIASLGDDIVFG